MVVLGPYARQVRSDISTREVYYEISCVGQVSQGEGVFGGLFARPTTVVRTAELGPFRIGDPVPRDFVSCARPEAKADAFI